MRPVQAQRPSRESPPTLLLFSLVWLAVLLTHSALLTLPYWWDEAGYYIPAAWDFFRTGSLIPHSTLSNAHPPLPSIYLAGAWWLLGYHPVVTRVAMSVVAALALAGVYRLAQVLLDDKRWPLATLVTLLTALYPVWFVQSTLAHADLFAAAGTLWALVFFFRAQLLPAVVCFAVAALSKEIAISFPLLLAARELLLPRPRGLRRAAWLITPALPLALWFGYHRAVTGFIFGNPEYLRYNAAATLSATRILLALGQRALHLGAHLNLFVPVLVTLGALALPPRAGAPAPLLHRRTLAALLLAHWVFFSVVGGALLTRYLLPLYPLILLLCVDVWRRHLSSLAVPAALTAAAFVLGFLINPPYRFAPEDTLAYRDAILLQQDAIAQIAHRYGHPTVLTAWPASDALQKPELGYVSHPFPVVAIDNFSPPQIERIAAQARTYSTALVFSTKYDPPQTLLSLLPPGLAARKQALDARYFDFHRDLPPAVIARLLGCEVVWQEERGGQWAAVLHFGSSVAPLIIDPTDALPRAPRPPARSAAARLSRCSACPASARCDRSRAQYPAG